MKVYVVLCQRRIGIVDILGIYTSKESAYERSDLEDSRRDNIGSSYAYVEEFELESEEG